jgi:hypothetical protein
MHHQHDRRDVNEGRGKVGEQLGDRRQAVFSQQSVPDISTESGVQGEGGGQAEHGL